VRCEDVKEPKTEDDFLKGPIFFDCPVGKYKFLKKTASCRSLFWKIHVQDMPRKMGLKYPHGVQDI